jgi:hypothetical protein
MGAWRKFATLGLFCALWGLSACAGTGPSITDNYVVHTPVFADNRVYHLEAPDSAGWQKLGSITAQVDPANPDIIQPNEPLSIILRSIEIPAATKDGPIKGPADYAVILDIGTASDGSSQSIIVWYQRGVQPGQSLNFSNLLVYHEPRWDQRVAPYFRVRVMDVTKDRNEETRRNLEAAKGITSNLVILADVPFVSPLIGVASTAAELVLGNKENRMLLDYSVQLYSTAALSASGSAGLGALKRGSYAVVGRPNEAGRAFWKNSFWYETESHFLAQTKRDGSTPTFNDELKVPVALLTVGTFESIVPKLVIERSGALLQMLTEEPGKLPIEQVETASDQLALGIKAFALGEKLKRYGDPAVLGSIQSTFVNDSNNADQLGSEDRFQLLRALNKCLALSAANEFRSFEDAKAYFTNHADARCQ